MNATVVRCNCGSYLIHGDSGLCDRCWNSDRGDRALATLQVLNEIISLGDLVYDVREREALGWEGPLVTAWGDACEEVRKLLGT